MRLIEAGLGIASGESPYAFANLKGAIPAIQGFQGDLKDINRRRGELEKTQRELVQAQQQFALTGSQRDQDRVDSISKERRTISNQLKTDTVTLAKAMQSVDMDWTQFEFNREDRVTLTKAKMEFDRQLANANLSKPSDFKKLVDEAAESLKPELRPAFRANAMKNMVEGMIAGKNKNQIGQDDLIRARIAAKKDILESDVRKELAKSQGLSKVPPSGADPKFDADVKKIYNDRIEAEVNNTVYGPYGVGGKGGGGSRSTFKFDAQGNPVQ
jgi:hypothetical protein